MIPAAQMPPPASPLEKGFEAGAVAAPVMVTAIAGSAETQNPDPWAGAAMEPIAIHTATQTGGPIRCLREADPGCRSIAGCRMTVSFIWA